MSLPRPKNLVVVILDGWGISFQEQGNAIKAANTPIMDMFAKHYPTASLSASGIEVGLPWGEVGNSETGHSNIGAGAVRYQALPMIDQAIADKSFFSNQVFQNAIAHTERHKSKIHLMGLLGPGGVHAHSNHLFALLQLLSKTKLREKTFVHLFTDGRDTPPQESLQYLAELENEINKHKTGTVASVTGRFYAMDRNQNWERTKATYDLLIGGPRGAGASSAKQAIEMAHQQNLSDEKVPPTAITQGGGPIAVVEANDAVIFFNFRPDRARQLTQAFSDPQAGFVHAIPQNIFFGTMTQYEKTQTAPAAFIEPELEHPLARIISEAGLKQLHIAETEKYAHVTYYLNGGHEEAYPNEERVLIKSSSVKNFAEEPAMAAAEITDRLITELEKKDFDVVFANYANADMVGHTGDYDAAVKACAIVDEQLGKLYQFAVKHNIALLITADHGNAEEMINLQTGEKTTDHSSNLVPLHYMRAELGQQAARSEQEITQLFSSPIGVLADVAPTVLEIMEIEKTPNMTGLSLLSSLQ